MIRADIEQTAERGGFGRPILAGALAALCALLIALTAGCPLTTPKLIPLPPGASGGPAPVHTGETKTSFYTWDEILNAITNWQQSYGPNGPNIVKVFKIGESWEERPIYAIKISKDADQSDKTTPDILITGGVHSSEWAGIETAMYVARHLIEDYDKDDYVRYIVDNSEIWIVPVVNPDGLVFSQSKADNDHRLWRKNRHPMPNGQVGVDLNRSYPFKWRLESDNPNLVSDDNGGSDDPASRHYRGEADPTDPGKPKVIEKEIRGLIDLVVNPEHRFVLYIDYHSFSEVILYPYGYSRDRMQKDFETYEFLSSGMALLINRNRGLLSIASRLVGDMADLGSRYTYSQASMLYLETTTGSSIDFYHCTRGVMSLGIEVSPAFTLRRFTYGTGFAIDPRLIVPIGAENFHAFLFAADWAIGPGFLKETLVEQDGKAAFHSIQNYGEDLQAQINSSTLKKGQANVKLLFNKPMILPAERRLIPEKDQGLTVLKLVDNTGRIHRINGSGYWTKTIYDGDTFIGTVSVSADAAFDFARGTVIYSAMDGIGFSPDLNPETRPVYMAGEGLWLNYERDRYARPPINESELTGAAQDHKPPGGPEGPGPENGRPRSD